MPESLTDQFISDLYPSLLHIKSDTGLTSPTNNDIEYIYDGVGKQTEMGFRNDGTDIVINNVVYPKAPSLIDWVDFIYPVGSILMSADDVNPGIRFIGSTWMQESKGRVVAGVGKFDDDTTFVTGNNGNTYNPTFTLKAGEIPYIKHDHLLRYVSGGWSAGGSNSWITEDQAREASKFQYLISTREQGGATDKEGPGGPGHTGNHVLEEKGYGYKWQADWNIDPHNGKDPNPVTIPNGSRSPNFAVYVWRRVN